MEPSLLKKNRTEILAIMKIIHTFKPQYTPEEIKDLIKWFQERMDQLPKTLTLDDSSSTEDLPQVVKILILRMGDCNITPTWSGYASHLFLIKERLIENGLFK